ncbi:ornithine carbamoyltransferase [Campylobacter corcagiensis]|uniref:Ornithine carbamoyltransferase n=1 Tax=Campylobacter corcagiensis TaxID=1448857 RepID=A0A7M1LJ59_9BACT|nr:ornithine carbamoyltransferase [Campylobacter corcagiensis]QKF64265.1 ornithine carbamoyltransferase [Campylobacter corcagiensis]QOQ87545.1 ornithine carbamoyltransferase [Campylobacter corcagiensis]
MRHFLTLKDYTKDEILEILDLADEIKAQTKKGDLKLYLKDKTLAMIFEKSSTRTRVSFEVGISQLGGKALFLSSRDIQLGRGEPVKDTARVLGRMVDMIMARVYKQSDLEELAKFSGIPVINGLSDDFHPVQLMADLMTMREFGKDINSLKVAYIGDGNNMANSYILAASKLGFELRIATPKGYEPCDSVLNLAFDFAKESGAKILLSNTPQTAINEADVVVTDTWISMGQEEEKIKRVKDFNGFTIDRVLMSLAKSDAIFLHCLPAYRGYEVSEELFEAHADEIFSEAENRLHAQKAVMVWLYRRKDE